MGGAEKDGWVEQRRMGGWRRVVWRSETVDKYCRGVREKRSGCVQTKRKEGCELV